MDVAKLISEGFDAVKDYIDRGFKTFAERLEAVESRSPEKGEPGRDGIDGKDGAPGPEGAPGKDGVDGKDGTHGAAGRDGIDGKDGAPGLDGKDGASVTRDDIIAAIKSDPSLLADAVALYLKANPPAAGKDGAPGENGMVGAKGEPGRDGKDGTGVAGAMISRDGNLTLTMSDGRAVSLGVVVGADGQPGKDGVPGRDGFGFDDLTAAHDGERTLKLTFIKGEAKKEFTFDVPAVIDRGVWREGSFKSGDAVTWDGSWFIAQADANKKPGTADSGWRLAAKRGRDGATAFDLAKRGGFKGNEAEWLSSLKGERGPEGRPGRDLTQLGFDGRKS